MEKSDGTALPFTGLRRCRAGGMKCLQGRQREHGLLLLVLCLHWDEQPGLGWELGLGAAAAHAPSSWCLSPSALEPPKKLPSHLPDPLRPPVLCSPHAWLDKLTSCTISFFPLPPLPALNSSKPRSEAKHKLDEQSLPVLQPCPASDQAEEGILQPLKREGRRKRGPGSRGSRTQHAALEPVCERGLEMRRHG